MSSYKGYEGWKQWSKATFGIWSAADAAYSIDSRAKQIATHIRTQEGL